MKLQYLYKTLWFLAFMIVFTLTVAVAVSAEIPPLNFDGDTVFINTSQAYISATPHTIQGIKPVVVEWESKQYSGNINIIFGYNGEYLKPFKLERYNPHQVCNDLYNEEGQYCYTEDWTEVATSNLDFVKINRNFNGKTDFYGFPNVNVNAGQTYKYRVWINAPSIPIGKTQEEVYPDYDGKYDIAFYPSSWGTDIIGAYQNNQLFVLDPEVNLTNGLIAYYSWDGGSVADNTSNSLDLTNNGATSVPSGGYLEGAYSYDGGNDYMTDTNDLFRLDNYTISSWIYVDDYSSGFRMITTRQGVGGGYNWQFRVDQTTGLLKNEIRNSANSASDNLQSNTVLSTGTWYHVATSFQDDGNMSIYINGELDNSKLSTITSVGTDAYPMDIGRRNDGFYFDGVIDELGIWNRALNISEIQELYNSGSGLAYPLSTTPTPTTPQYFEINATNLYNNSEIEVFDATINSVVYATTNGTIITDIHDNSTSLYDIYINATNYIPINYTNYNVSNNLQANITQAELRLNCLEFISNISLNCDENKVFLNVGLYNITANVSGYNSITKEVNITALLNTSTNYENFTNANINISVNNTITNTFVDNYNIRLENIQYGFNKTYSTTGSNLLFNLTQGLNYTFYFTKSGFLPAQASITNYTNTSLQLNVTSININLQFYDEISQELITNLVSFELHYDDSNASEGNTTTGATTLELNNTGELEIQYSSNGYDLRRYFLDITETTTGTFSLYLLDQTNSTEISYLLTDENGVPLENAKLKVQRRYIEDGLTTYHTVSMSKSDINGEGSVFLQKYSPIYRFIIEYNGATILITSPTEIEQNNIVLRGTVEESATESIYKIAGIDWISGYEDYTFSLSWNDDQDIIDEVCFTLYRIRGTGRSIVNNSCSSLSVDTISFTLDNTSTGDFLAIGTVDTNTNFSEYNIATLTAKLDNIKNTIGLQGVFFTGVFVVLAGTSAIFSIPVAIILSVFSVIIGAFAGWVSIGYGTIMLLVTMAGFMIYSFRRGVR